MENAAAAYIVHWWKWETKRLAESLKDEDRPRQLSNFARILPLNSNLSDTPVDVIIAMETFHHEKRRLKLLERLSENSVLETLHSVQYGVLGLWENLNSNGSFPPHQRDTGTLGTRDIGINRDIGSFNNPDIGSFSNRDIGSFGSKRPKTKDAEIQNLIRNQTELAESTSQLASQLNRIEKTLNQILNSNNT